MENVCGGGGVRGEDGEWLSLSRSREGWAVVLFFPAVVLLSSLLLAGNSLDARQLEG